MPSPFPGMDPYLENPELWRDFHHRMITYIGDQLQPKLRPKYFARTEERVFVAEADRYVYPDVAILREPRARYDAGGVPVMEPLLVERQSEPIHEGLITILAADTGQLVTAIEVLSPTNKMAGDGRAQYLQKRSEVLRSFANMVEIDLLKEGARVTQKVRDQQGERDYRYVISVSRAQKRSLFEMYPLTLRDKLPLFRIPLKNDDPDVVLDLQAVFVLAYENGAYDATIDYAQPPRAPLSDDERAYIASVLNGN